ncbi:MAG: ATP-binding cassette domain-containing protein, partial [Mogibacterium sp.]|nr:ATP-binding cassette domain-containing protein [Mogibacterium sp.]
MLAIRDLDVHYGGIHALRGVNIDVPDGKIISLIGANGAGKSTTLKAIMSLVPKSGGHVYWDDTEITSFKTKDVVSEGIILCPEGRR